MDKGREARRKKKEAKKEAEEKEKEEEKEKFATLQVKVEELERKLAIFK